MRPACRTRMANSIIARTAGRARCPGPRCPGLMRYLANASRALGMSRSSLCPLKWKSPIEGHVDAHRVELFADREARRRPLRRVHGDAHELGTRTRQGLDLRRRRRRRRPCRCWSSTARRWARPRRWGRRRRRRWRVRGRRSLTDEKSGPFRDLLRPSRRESGLRARRHRPTARRSVHVRRREVMPPALGGDGSLLSALTRRDGEWQRHRRPDETRSRETLGAHTRGPWDRLPRSTTSRAKD